MLILSRFRIVTMKGVWTGWLDLLHLCTKLVTASNTALSPKRVTWCSDRIYLFSSAPSEKWRTGTLLYLHVDRGRGRAQAASRWFPTAAARVRAQVRSCGICGEQSGTGAGFLRVLQFPLTILIPPTAPHSSDIVRGWYNRPISGRRTEWTQSHPTPRN
jgi:hypothetical protein